MFTNKKCKCFMSLKICEIDVRPHKLAFYHSFDQFSYFISSNVQEHPEQENVTKTEEPDQKILPRMLFNLPSRNATISSPSESSMYCSLWGFFMQITVNIDIFPGYLKLLQFYS